MADRVAPISAVNYPTDSFRELVDGLVFVQGVVGTNDLLVSQHAGTPGMSVDVAAGFVFLQGILNTVNQGMYGFLKDAIQTYTIAAADPTNPRRDLVCAVVTDSIYGVDGTANAQNIRVITGTPAGSPVDPAIPGTWSAYVLLGRVRLPANATSVTNAIIDDLRPHVVLQGAQIIATSSTRPSSPYTGQHLYETDTKREAIWDGSAWHYLGNPELNGTGTATSLTAPPSLPGNKFWMQAGSSVLTFSGGTATLTFVTPFTAPPLTIIVCNGDQGSGDIYLQVGNGSTTASATQIVAKTESGNSPVTGPVRCNWIALGW